MTVDSNSNKHVIIIGAGAAGLMAAGSIRSSRITVFDGNEKAGKKIYITGKGRCNVTNNCSPRDFLDSVVRGSKFVYSSINGFTPNDTMQMLESNGVEVKTERGNRVFPSSDKSSDVIKALYNRALNNGAQIKFNERVNSVVKNGDTFTVETTYGKYACDSLIIATGGKSYPSTGSTGDGYEFAKVLGHKIIRPVPSLTSFVLKQDVSDLSGLTLKNVEVTAKSGGKTYYEFGELLFTHNGISGPTVLRLSALLNRASMPFEVSIDLKPALSDETLDKRILSDFSKNANKQLKNSLGELLPKSLIPVIIARSKIDGEEKINIITKAQRHSLLCAIKSLTYTVTSLGSFNEAVVTSGGVDCNEVNPKTMESKLVSGLYFAGEVLDIDALTGGFNLQLAFSTAYAAAKAISKN